MTLPMETECMKEGREGFHHQQHTKCHAGPNSKADEDSAKCVRGTVLEGEHQHPVPEDL